MQGVKYLTIEFQTTDLFRTLVVTYPVNFHVNLVLSRIPDKLSLALDQSN